MGTRLAVMAGGTGGHVFPALAVAERLRRQGADVFWIGTHAGMESRLVPEHGFDMEWVSIEGVRGKGLAQVLKAPAKLLAALSQARGIFRRRRPDLVLGMGGFVSGPGGLAARTLGLPLVIHEQNFVPGMTNQWLARMATRVFEAFPGSFPASRHAVLTGNPVREAIAELPAPAERFAGRAGPARLLVLGGSLGARVLNETVPLAIAALPAQARPQIRHQAGERTLEVARAAYAASGVDAEVTPFIRDMAEAYAWADLVLCRAGALTVSELAAAGVGSVLVPYPFAVDDHQVGNARYLADVGAAHLVVQHELTAAGLTALLAELLGDRTRLRTMAEAARSRAQPEATARITAACLELADGSRSGADERLKELPGGRGS
ncbi:undecaprenyldiphospho-muramoylpentapeptide beta-N-acetylglucosaminyltransferase [Thiorhodococcus minor]|uniref:UDP-N-acetylglucosamine--N-acetylmuramyl-(pentapeptide) pyrophosphoryl-undecaprenol N-acetylglucosamine transferase n=1 Tax=Thiorhodococcus minor TaxID=57489 RepID=A0A6M0JY42_9GAMM|nr:undecaprenyldiphospho-muramoylpentapeptide beta-N-acetylglucosaminyltransferase [Thiorhodococcus minor]NEV61984.1 undecaprenyldiphospho-muramoylpentapeptide beta-N-acetylglucosaminyltransferase [Thiorhodococcus minor]